MLGYRPTRSEDTLRGDAARAELQQMAEQMQSMQRELRALRAERTAAPQRVAPAEPAAGQAVEPQPQRTPAPAERAAEPIAEQTKRYVEHADRVLAEQARDSTWSEARDLPLKLNAILPRGSSIQSVSCGTTLCRVETIHHGLDAYQAFVGDLASRPKAGDTEFKKFWSGPSAYLQLGDPEEQHGELHAVAYLARENAALPELPAQP
jgi:hypothetical protein